MFNELVKALKEIKALYMNDMLSKEGQQKINHEIVKGAFENAKTDEQWAFVAIAEWYYKTELEKLRGENNA